MTPKLTLFCDPALLCLVDRPLLTRVLEGFTDCLPSAAVPLLDCDLNYEQFCAAWAAHLGSPEHLGPRLLQALAAIEWAARPENHQALEDALDHLPQGWTINRARCHLNQALHLWLISQTHHDVLFPIAPGLPVQPVQPVTSSPVPPVTSSPVPPVTSSPVQPVTGSPVQPVTGSPVQPVIGSPLEPDGCANALQSKIENQKSKIPSPETEQEAFARLAKLPLVEYERVRLKEAKRLHLRVGALDAEVEKLRAQLEFEAQTRSVDLTEFEPWPEPVNLADTLDQVRGRFNAYLALPAGASIALTLWDAHTFAPDAFHISPRLNLQSAEGGAGKTTTLDVIGTMVPRALRTESLSQAVLYRVVHQFHPVLELDEGDTYLHNDELRGLLNGGHKRGSRAIRCNGEGYGVRGYNAYAPCVLAGLGSLPATLRDRSIIIPLVAAEPGQIAVRFDSRHVETETILARKLTRWFKDNFANVAACDPPMPPGAFNRIADNWRPLFAIAHLAGGHWPALAIEAYNQLAHLARPNRGKGAAANGAVLDSETVQLLSHIREVFELSGASRMFSTELVRGLSARNGNGGMTGMELARKLQPLGVRPKVIRIGTEQARGYELADFAGAFGKAFGKGEAVWAPEI